MLQYLSEVPVNAHSFLHGLFAFVEARLCVVVVVNVSYTAVVVVFVGFDAPNVQLTGSSKISVLTTKRYRLGTTGINYFATFQTN